MPSKMKKNVGNKKSKKKTIKQGIAPRSKTRKLNTKVGKTSRAKQRAAPLPPTDTFQSWLANQVKEFKSPRSEATAKKSVPPSTYDQWLSKQHVSESVVVTESESVRVPDSREEWLNKQVAERSARADEDEKLSEQNKAEESVLQKQEPTISSEETSA